MKLKKEIMFVLSLSCIIVLFCISKIQTTKIFPETNIIAEVVEPTQLSPEQMQTIPSTTACTEMVPAETEVIQEEVLSGSQNPVTEPLVTIPEETTHIAEPQPTEPDVAIADQNQPTQTETAPLPTEEELPEVETTTPSGYIKPAPVKAEITKLPDKIYYAVGEKLNTSGMVVKVTYDNGKTRIISNVQHEVVVEYGENTVAIHYTEDDKVFTNHVTVFGGYQVTYKAGTGIFRIGNYPNKVLYTAKGKVLKGEYMEPKMAGMYFDNWYIESGEVFDPENITLNGNITVTAKYVEPHR